MFGNAHDGMLCFKKKGIISDVYIKAHRNSGQNILIPLAPF